jgi:hypothetical protein
MKMYYDLHIHSCLSPCASDDMTPANIAGMAHIKGLSLVSLTDHNCGRNLPAMANAAKTFGLVFVPGIEITSREEVHVLAYFDDVGAAVEFGERMYASLAPVPNRPEIFGRQIQMNMHDSIAGEADKLLLTATSYTIDELAVMVKKHGGCAVPAHINRDSFSVFSNLGYFPVNLFQCAEVSDQTPLPAMPPGLCLLRSSDAHQLEDISEPDFFLNDISRASDLVFFINNYPLF